MFLKMLKDDKGVMPTSHTNTCTKSSQTGIAEISKNKEELLPEHKSIPYNYCCTTNNKALFN